MGCFCRALAIRYDGAGADGIIGAADRAGAGGGTEVDVAYEQLLPELRGAGDRPARVIDDDRMPVEDEFVLPADEPAEGDMRYIVPGALSEHALAVGALARVVGGG